MTHSCICAVVAIIGHQPSSGFNSASLTLTIRCLQIGWSWTWTKLNFSGLVRDMLSRRRVVVILPYSLLLILFIQVSMSEYWELRVLSQFQPQETRHKSQHDLLLTSLSTSTCPAYTQYGVSYDTGARLCNVSSQLLQCHFHWGSKGYHWQVAASAEQHGHKYFGLQSTCSIGDNYYSLWK